MSPTISDTPVRSEEKRGCRVPGAGGRGSDYDDGTTGHDGAPDKEATPDQDTETVPANKPASYVQTSSPEFSNIVLNREVVLATTKPSSLEPIHGGDGI